MRITFPSHEFDETVANVCHGLASDGQMQWLNELLRQDAAARDEYILRVELHSRLASEPDLFPTALGQMNDPLTQPEGARASTRFNVLLSGVTESSTAQPTVDVKRRERHAPVARVAATVIALAACLALLGTAWWGLNVWQRGGRKGATSNAVAMLNRVVDAQWSGRDEPPRLGAPLGPGWLRLKSGLVQIVFYSGARVVIEGPAELQLISSGEASCHRGKLTAEVPPQARGFRIRTPQMDVTDLGTAFGLDVKERQTELHVFNGSVELASLSGANKQNLKEGAGAVVEGSRPPRPMAANPEAFASLFDFQLRSSDAGVLRHEQWRATSSRLDEDPSLLVHFDFERTDRSDWRLPNASNQKAIAPDATIVGCQWTEGRWPDKQSLEFRGVSDRVRLNVPGEFESLTLAAWVRVQGLDRRINSLFMSDGFEPGTVHWSVRDDGVLGLTVIGSRPGDFQIAASPPVLGLDQFGLWLHLAVVLDGPGRRVAHYVNGVPVNDKALKMDPPFRIGAAELGNWNAREFPNHDPFHIRNFSGAMDEFCLFSRALKPVEIRALHAEGKPQPDPAVQTRH